MNSLYMYDYDSNNLKAYATQLLDAYIAINEKVIDSSLYCKLAQYIKEDRIAKIIRGNSSNQYKAEILNYYRYSIIEFARVSGKAISVETLDAMILRMKREKKIDKLLLDK